MRESVPGRDGRQGAGQVAVDAAHRRRKPRQGGIQRRGGVERIRGRHQEHESAENSRSWRLFLDFQLPLKLAGMRSVMTVKGKEKLGQQEVYVVEAAPAQGGPRILAFDAQTGLLALADSVFFEDYREIDGAQAPLQGQASRRPDCRQLLRNQARCAR